MIRTKYIEIVLERWKNGETVYSIAKDLNITRHTVARWLKNQGYDVSAGYKIRSIPLICQTNEIIQKFYSGMNREQIAKEYKTSNKYITNILKSKGII